MAWYLSPRIPQSAATSSSAVTAVTSDMFTADAEQRPAVRTPREEPSRSVSPDAKQRLVPDRDSAAFPHDAYAIRLRTSWIAAAFRIGDAEYTIAPVPNRRGAATFSFSQRSGVLGQEPGGAELLRLQPAAHGLTTQRYVVSEDAMETTRAIFERAGRDWKVLDAAGEPLAFVEEVEARPGFRRYVANVDGHEVCHFTWAMHGLGVWTAALDVEFRSSIAGRFDRSLAIALGPLLEQHARRNSQWYS